jgi:hypothetical protein
MVLTDLGKSCNVSRRIVGFIENLEESSPIPKKWQFEFKAANLSGSLSPT